MVEFQCAVAARDRNESMFATASQVRRWLLIEVRGAWGRDAVADSDLARYASAGWRGRLQADQIRVIAIRRDLDRSSQRALEMFYVESGGGSDRGRCWRRRVPTLRAAADAASELTTTDGWDDWQSHRAPLLLVCTNGRHDACCATFGRPLARDLRHSAGQCRRLGVLAHRRRSLRCQRRDPARRLVLRSLRQRVCPTRDRRVRPR